MTIDGSSCDCTAAEALRRWNDLTRCRSTHVADDVRFEMAAAPWGRLPAVLEGAVNGLRPRNAEAVAKAPWPHTAHDRRLASHVATRS
jgi:hypothetical protein